MICIGFWNDSGVQGCPCTKDFLCAHDNLGVFGGPEVCNVHQHNWYFGHGGGIAATQATVTVMQCSVQAHVLQDHHHHCRMIDELCCAIFNKHIVFLQCMLLLIKSSAQGLMSRSLQLCGHEHIMCKSTAQHFRPGILNPVLEAAGLLL